MPNGATALFLIDDAEAAPEEMAEMEVAAVLFDGHDAQAVARARECWRQVTEAGLKAVYWAQDAGGGWVKKHEAG